ncbi:MAG: FAD-dependent oxidoreductase [Cyanobium sp.]
MSTTTHGNGVDVVVVGAGLSGLVCARELRRRGATVQLLEARDRCGGRMHGRLSQAGTPVDLGGQWVGASHHQLQALLEDLGLRRFATHYEGHGVFHWNGVPHRARVEHNFDASLLFFRPAELASRPLSWSRRCNDPVHRRPGRSREPATGSF